MRWAALVVVASLLLVPVDGRASEGKVLDVYQAVEIALDGNVDLKRAENSVEASAVSVSQSRTAFLPVLQASLGPSLHLGRQFDAISREYTGYVSGSLSLGLNLDLMLFDGLASVHALRGAKLGHEASKHGLTRAQQDVVYATVVAYVAVLTDEELVAVAGQNVQAQEQLLDLVQAQKEVGKAVTADVYKQRAELESARLTLLQAQGDLEMDMLELERVLGIESGSIAGLEPIEVSGDVDEWPEPDAGESLEQALESRPDVQEAIARIDAAEKQVDVARAGYIPRVYFFASVGTSWSSSMSEYYGFNEQMWNNNLGGVLGLSISIPIFDGLATKYAVDGAQVEVTGQTLELEGLEQQIELEVTQAVVDYGKLRLQLEVAARQLEYATQSFESYEECYAQGGCTLVDVSQSRALELQASYDVVQARYGLLLGAVAIAYQTGDTDGMLAIPST